MNQLVDLYIELIRQNFHKCDLSYLDKMEKYFKLLMETNNHVYLTAFLNFLSQDIKINNQTKKIYDRIFDFFDKNYSENNLCTLYKLKRTIEKLQKMDFSDGNNLDILKEILKIINQITSNKPPIPEESFYKEIDSDSSEKIKIKEEKSKNEIFNKNEIERNRTNSKKRINYNRSFSNKNRNFQSKFVSNKNKENVSNMTNEKKLMRNESNNNNNLDVQNNYDTNNKFRGNSVNNKYLNTKSKDKSTLGSILFSDNVFRYSNTAYSINKAKFYFNNKKVVDFINDLEEDIFENVNKNDKNIMMSRLRKNVIKYINDSFPFYDLSDFENLDDFNFLIFFPNLIDNFVGLKCDKLKKEIKIDIINKQKDKLDSLVIALSYEEDYKTIKNFIQNGYFDMQNDKFSKKMFYSLYLLYKRKLLEITYKSEKTIENSDRKDRENQREKVILNCFLQDEILLELLVILFFYKNDLEYTDSEYIIENEEKINIDVMKENNDELNNNENSSSYNLINTSIDQNNLIDLNENIPSNIIYNNNDEDQNNSNHILRELNSIGEDEIEYIKRLTFIKDEDYLESNLRIIFDFLIKRISIFGFERILKTLKNQVKNQTSNLKIKHDNMNYIYPNEKIRLLNQIKTIMVEHFSWRKSFDYLFFNNSEIDIILCILILSSHLVIIIDSEENIKCNSLNYIIRQLRKIKSNFLKERNFDKFKESLKDIETSMSKDVIDDKDYFKKINENIKKKKHDDVFKDQCLQFIKKDKFNNQKISLIPYGSLVYYLNNVNSDTDLLMYYKDFNIDMLKSMEYEIKKALNIRQGNLELVINQRLFSFQKIGIHKNIDLNLTGVCGLFNSLLINIYFSINPSFYILARYLKESILKCLKEKMSYFDDNINGKNLNEINSYTWNLLLLNFLQNNCNPPILNKILQNKENEIDQINNNSNNSNNSNNCNIEANNNNSINNNNNNIEDNLNNENINDNNLGTDIERFLIPNSTYNYQYIKKTDDMLETFDYENYFISKNFKRILQLFITNKSEERLNLGKYTNWKTENKIPLSVILIKFLEYIIYDLKEDCLIIDCFNESISNIKDATNTIFFKTNLKNKVNKCALIIRDPFDHLYIPSSGCKNENLHKIRKNLEEIYLDLLLNKNKNSRYE